VARARRVPGDVLASAAGLDSRVYHRLSVKLCVNPHAHCVGGAHTIRMRGRSEIGTSAELRVARLIGHVHVHTRVRVRACVRACMRACVRACARVRGP
jgi:hypothetical protein